jgi:hypothetical protein
MTYLRERDSSLHRFDFHFPTMRTVFSGGAYPPYYANRIFHQECEMDDSLFLLLILAFYGLTVLMLYGIERLGRPS